MGWSGRIAVGDGELDVDVLGDGEAVVVIQTALDAGELGPLAEHVAATGRRRVVHLHRRGYAGSSPVTGRPSIAGDAADCRAAMAGLAVAPAHVVGASYSAAVALTLAADAPEPVRTLTLIEPPPLHVPSATEFRAANARLLDVFRSTGSLAALEAFMTLLVGRDWRDRCERDRPGSVAAMERDASTFFRGDIPALLTWNFGAAEARGIGCPVLYVGGSRSGPWFAQVRAWVLALLPHAETVTVGGAGHLLASTHPARTADLIVDFLDRRVTRVAPP